MHTGTHLFWKIAPHIICQKLTVLQSSGTVLFNLYSQLPKWLITVTMWSRVWLLAAWILGFWAWIPLSAWTFVLVFQCHAVLYKHRPCDGLTTNLKSPTKCQSTQFWNFKNRWAKFSKMCTAIDWQGVLKWCGVKVAKRLNIPNCSTHPTRQVSKAILDSQ